MDLIPAILIIIYIIYSVVDSRLMWKDIQELNERLDRLEMGSILPTIQESEIPSQSKANNRKSY